MNGYRVTLFSDIGQDDRDGRKVKLESDAANHNTVNGEGVEAIGWDWDASGWLGIEQVFTSNWQWFFVDVPEPEGQDRTFEVTKKEPG